jgi:hypothetical protein
MGVLGEREAASIPELQQLKKKYEERAASRMQKAD